MIDTQSFEWRFRFTHMRLLFACFMVKSYDRQWIGRKVLNDN